MNFSRREYSHGSPSREIYVVLIRWSCPRSLKVRKGNENVPGGGARQMEKRRRRARILLVILAIATVITLFSITLSARNVMISLLVLAALAFVDRATHRDLDWFEKRADDAGRGAEAEEAVGTTLSCIPDCEVLHDVPAQFGNIDHLVFRKDGAILLIETKSYRGKVTERSAEKFLQQTHRNLFWLRDFLKDRFGIEAWINAAIVFPNAYVTVRRPLRGVDFINSKYLERWMNKVRGNPQLAKNLWPRIQEVKWELAEPY